MDFYVLCLVGFLRRKIRFVKEDEIDKFCAAFEDEPGFHIPYLPMLSILNRAKKKGIIEKKEHILYVREDKLSNFVFDTKDAEDNIENLVRILEQKIESIFPNSGVNEDTVKKILLKYLYCFNYQLLFLSSSDKVIKHEKRDPNLFRLAKALNSLYEERSKGWDLFIKIVFGYFISRIVLHEPNLLNAKYKGLKVYLDTKIILRILGCEGELLRKIYVDFIKNLASAGIELFIFEHTYYEIKGILEACFKWIDNPNYDPSKASIALRHFKEMGSTQSDVQFILSNLESNITNFGIKIDYTHYSDQDQIKIDEELLKEIILEVYSGNPYFEPDEKDQTIKRDVRSISLIYHFRKGNLTGNFKHVKYLFVTCNAGLNYAVYKFHNENYSKNAFSIPPCVTDTFIGTLIWLNQPISSKSDITLPVISQNLTLMQPSKDFLEKWISEIRALKERGEITEDAYILLRDYQLARELLEEKTLGDPEQITSKSFIEILKEIEQKAKAEEQKKYEELLREHQKTEEELNFVRKEKENIEKNLDVISNFLAWFLTGVFICTALISWYF